MVLNDSRTDDMASDVLRERCIVTSLCISIACPTCLDANDISILDRHVKLSCL